MWLVSTPVCTLSASPFDLGGWLSSTKRLVSQSVWLQTLFLHPQPFSLRSLVWLCSLQQTVDFFQRSFKSSQIVYTQHKTHLQGWSVSPPTKLLSRTRRVGGSHPRWVKVYLVHVCLWFWKSVGSFEGRRKLSWQSQCSPTPTHHDHHHLLPRLYPRFFFFYFFFSGVHTSSRSYLSGSLFRCTGAWKSCLFGRERGTTVSHKWYDDVSR